MCGISAIINGNVSADTERRVERMVGAMRHRGPDSSGVNSVRHGVVGHARLSIIDTSASGAQPMTRGGVTLVYNGECYNFLQERSILEKRGCSFSSHTDTEVLLNMYLEYGEDFVKRLRGIFAFVLYDARSGKFLCARDHLGVKPLLYAQRGNNLIVASELRAMLASGLVEPEADRESLYLLLRHGSVPQPRTMLQGVYSLMPGHIMRWCNGKTSIKQYWRMKTGRLPLRKLSCSEIMEAGREAVEEALRLQLVSDVPLGAFLSGGIDSSLLVALMQRSHGNVRTFSIGFESDLDTASEDETSDAEEVARHLGCQHETVIVSRSEIIDVLPRIARDLDHPTVDGVNSWFVSKVASKELTVAVSGTGGDELFCGYPWFAGMHDQESGTPGWKRLARSLLGKDTFAERYRWHYFIYDPAAAEQLMPWGAHPELAPSDPLPLASPLERVSGLTLAGYTQNQLLFDIDTASMAHSLEVRVPLLDVRLLDFALSLPSAFKYGGGDGAAPQGSYAHSGVKRMLVDMGRGMLPPGFDRRAKRGFTLPFDGWLRSELAGVCRELLSRDVVRRRGFFNQTAVSAVLLDFDARNIYWPRVWLLMMVELWAQQVLDVRHDV